MTGWAIKFERELCDAFGVLETSQRADMET